MPAQINTDAVVAYYRILRILKGDRYALDEAINELRMLYSTPEMCIRCGEDLVCPNCGADQYASVDHRQLSLPL